ncbi:MAG: hypothetical protein K2W82_16720 [Candidatus Obscuribacterales bacterium]|nr:hypothetical protein [Candidatus Obscuribacterales bacterium]
MNEKLHVDIDETLVKTRHLAPDEPVKPGWNLIEFRKGDKLFRYQSIVRPSARAFLERMQQYQPDISTSGGAEFQIQVLELHGLRSLVGNVYGGDYSEVLTLQGPWVLLDDLPAFPCNGIVQKFRRCGLGDTGFNPSNEVWMPLIQRHLVRPEIFEGEEDPQPLTDLIPLIEERFALQR